MKVLNIHSRIIQKPFEVTSLLLDSLATEVDPIWPSEHWPKIKFKNGLQVGSKGGHGIVRYSIEKYIPNQYIEFKFSKPKGFFGIHKFEIIKKDQYSSEFIHTIDAHMKGIALITWPLAIRPLHNALIEDAFDKVEGLYSSEEKKTAWSPWVRFLRKLLGA